MTLWNPLNVFSGTQKRAGDDPSASFDPTRTGDPLPAGQDRPAIGFGVTRVGNPAGYGDPPRNPIGFAPAEDAVTEPRYLTELSFKRHHELPRATTTSDVPEQGEMHPWQTPQAMSDETIDSEPDFFELDAPALEVAAVAPGAEKVPFFKREISFRRKRATDGDPATEVADDEQSTDLAAAADEDYGIRGYDEEREAAVTDDDSVSDDADDPFEVEVLAVEEPMTRIRHLTQAARSLRRRRLARSSTKSPSSRRRRIPTRRRFRSTSASSASAASGRPTMPRRPKPRTRMRMPTSLLPQATIAGRTRTTMRRRA